MATVMVIGCLAGLTYIYAGYPLLIWVCSKVRARPVRKNSAATGMGCSVVIAAYHEGPVLSRKVESILESLARGSIREIVIGLDGPPGGLADSLPFLLPPLNECKFPGSRAFIYHLGNASLSLCCHIRRA